MFNSETNIYIASLDPLKADGILAKLPEMNVSKDVRSIICAVQSLLPALEDINNFSLQQAIACVRDLGILAGSIKRHGVEPIESIPALEAILTKFGNMTDMVPRDTLIHYSTWNPDGERQRRYTGYIDEIRLIESVKIALPRLEGAIQKLTLLHSIPMNSSNFALIGKQCAENLTGMVEAIVYTIKNVSRKVFSEELRVYFDPITVQGKQYLGAGAVEMPLFVFDHLLWGAEYQDERYLNFKHSLLPYCIPSFRKLYGEFIAQPSLLAKVCHELKTSSVATEIILENAKTLMNLFNILLKFRKSHIKVVDDAYISAKNHVREKGSGGYQMDMLQHLTNLTTKATQQLIESITLHENLPKNCHNSHLADENINVKSVSSTPEFLTIL